MRDYISATYLMAAPAAPGKTFAGMTLAQLDAYRAHKLALYLGELTITRVAAQVANGAVRKSRGGAIVGGTSPKWSAITPRGNSVRGLAARGW